MVLENLIPVRLAEQKPWNMFPIAFLFSTIAIFLALWIFPSHAAIVAVFLTTLACMPLMLKVIGFEKEKEERTRDYIKQLLLSFFRGGRREKYDHAKAEPQERLLYFFVFLFLGLALSFTFWFVVLPSNLVTNLFYIQLNTIKEINAGVVGSAVIAQLFSRILLNNIKVLAFCIFFSFIYGAGAIFILVWNASVIGVAMGNSIRSAMAAKLAGLTGIVGYSSIVSVSLLRYLLHGIPEILAYFIGGLAGGIISIAVLKQERGSTNFKNSMYHAFSLVILAVVILIIAALLEVTVSPLIRI